MTILRFLARAPRGALLRMVSLAVVSGIANALLIVAVNEVTDEIADGERPGILAWGGFLAAFAVFYMGNKLALLGANTIMERLLRDLRIGLMDRLRRCEKATVDDLGAGRVHRLVSQETSHLSATFPLVIDGVQQAILLMMGLLYLAYLSGAALLTFLAAVTLGGVIYSGLNRHFGRIAESTQSGLAQMLDAVGDAVHGAKELRLSEARTADVLTLHRSMTRQAQSLLLMSGAAWAAIMMVGAMVTYLLLGVVTFALPALVPDIRGDLVKILPVLLFCLGPVGLLVSQSPLFLRAAVGLRSLLDLERRLDDAAVSPPDMARRDAPAWQGFRTIALQDLTFGYPAAGPDEAPFSVGPLSLTLRRGEMVFLVGGNGSGKSTVLRLLTGLLPADGGHIVVDGRRLDRRDIVGYRELFAAIFVDFHLFDRLYGLEDVDPARVNTLIADMGLNGKVHYENGGFSRLALSTGQRKRLALIAALLEDRPIYVFDEWSAEQDVHFRDHFYTKILPDLKARGITVIAVTHDERYWSVADRVIKMDLGSVVGEEGSHPPVAN